MLAMDFSEETEALYQNALQDVLLKQNQERVSLVVDAMLDHIEDGYVPPLILDAALTILDTTGKSAAASWRKLQSNKHRVIKEAGLSSLDDKEEKPCHPAINFINVAEKITQFASRFDVLERIEGRGAKIWADLVSEYYQDCPNQVQISIHHAHKFSLPGSDLYCEAKKKLQILTVSKEDLKKEQTVPLRVKNTASAFIFAPGLH